MSKKSEYDVQKAQEVIQEHYLVTLTTIIDNINDEPRITHQLLHSKMWHHFDKLRHDPQRETLIKDWKYKSYFLSAEECHQSDENTSPQSSWEQSYTMFFYLLVYY
jgi:hypothetical protein